MVARLSYVRVPSSGTPEWLLVQTTSFESSFSTILLPGAARRLVLGNHWAVPAGVHHQPGGVEPGEQSADADIERYVGGAWGHACVTARGRDQSESRVASAFLGYLGTRFVRSEHSKAGRVGRGVVAS